MRTRYIVVGVFRRNGVELIHEIKVSGVLVRKEFLPTHD